MCALYVRCALSVLQKECRKVWGARYRSENTVLIGDSHARNCAQLLQDNLSADFKVSSFVKPGACMNEVTNSVRKELKTLNDDDFVLV
jgi:hypothetical protein